MFIACVQMHTMDFGSCFVNHPYILTSRRLITKATIKNERFSKVNCWLQLGKSDLNEEDLVWNDLLKLGFQNFSDFFFFQKYCEKWFLHQSS